MNKQPSPNGPNGGRDPRGRFLKGNGGGPGNPHAKRVAKLRSVVIAAVTETDLRAIVQRLVLLAKTGDVAAAKLLLDRILGPAESLDFIERLETLEAARRAEQ
jgi:hypothetical protein